MQAENFENAGTVIALDEAEHRPMMLRDFPQRRSIPSQQVYSPDLPFASPAEVLPAIRRQVERPLRYGH